MESSDKKSWHFNPVPRVVRNKNKNREEPPLAIRTESAVEWLACMKERGELIFCEVMKAKMTKNHCRAIHRKIMDGDTSYLSYETMLKCKKCGDY